MRTIKCDIADFGFTSLTPAPRVQAFCYFPSLNLGRPVDFMIDTGASSTCLNGIYAWGLMPYLKKQTTTPSTGIGGSCGYYRINGKLTFIDTKGKEIEVDLLIGIQRIKSFLWKKPRQMTLRTPCLLGRDILNKWKLIYDCPGSNVWFETP